MDGIGSEIIRLARAVNQKNPSADDIAALRRAMSQMPKAAAALGDLGSMVRSMFISHGFELPSQQVSLEIFCNTLRDGLGYATSPTHERLLIDHVINCWLRLHHLEQLSINGGYVPDIERRLSTAQHRFLRAVESLARVRRLGVNLQVNIANQQVVSN
jgi:hypothetical protein